MGSVMQFGAALGLAGSAGVRAYFPLIVVGLLARYSEIPILNPPYQILSSVPFLLLLVILAAFELLPETLNGVWQNQNLALMIIRGLAGAVLFSGVFSGFGLFFGFLFGGMTAVLAFMISVRFKMVYRHGFDEVITIVGTLLALLMPWSWYIIWGIVLFYLLKMFRKNQYRSRSQVRPKFWR